MLQNSQKGSERTGVSLARLDAPSGVWGAWDEAGWLQAAHCCSRVLASHGQELLRDLRQVRKKQVFVYENMNYVLTGCVQEPRELCLSTKYSENSRAQRNEIRHPDLLALIYLNSSPFPAVMF